MPEIGSGNQRRSQIQALFTQLNTSMELPKKEGEVGQLLKELDTLLPRNNIGEEQIIYKDMVEQGVLHTFGMILGKFTKFELSVVLDLSNILLDFTAFIEVKETKPTKVINESGLATNLNAIQAFIDFNLVNRVYSVIKTINFKFEHEILRQQSTQ